MGLEMLQVVFLIKSIGAEKIITIEMEIMGIKTSHIKKRNVLGMMMYLRAITGWA